MNYNLTFLETNTNLLQITSSVNSASGNILATMMMFVLWIGLFIVYKKEDSFEDFILSSFLTSIIASLMLFMGLLTWQIAVIPIFATLVSVIVRSLQ